MMVALYLFVLFILCLLFYLLEKRSNSARDTGRSIDKMEKDWQEGKTNK